MKRTFLCFFVISLSLLPVTALSQPAMERTVIDHVLTSERQPKVTIEISKSFTYEGGVRWPLYGIADCELHAFAETGADGKVTRLVWIQFEGYLPERPELHYGYDSRDHVKIDGRDFFVDIFTRSGNASTRAGSDREHIEALLKQHGAVMPEKMNYVRLVHLLDDQKRRELMIIYGEEASTLSLGAGAGTASSTLLDRATGALRIRFAD